MDTAQAPAIVETWARGLIERQIEAAGEALEEYCGKPKSAKRLHAARKQLARLRAALDDLSPIAGVAPEFRDRIGELHRRAGRIRDADVLLKRIAEYCDGAFGQERKQLGVMNDELRRKRRKGRRKFLDALAGSVSELRR